MIKQVIAVGIALASSFFLAACGVLAPAAPAAKQLTITVGSLPQSGDPNFDTSLFANPVYRLMYDTLIESDSGSPQPALAESWKQVDGLTWDFKLRSGLKFQNGEPLDAIAVKWNFDRIKDPATKSQWAPRFGLVDSVEAVDSATVRFHTSQPFATLLGNLVKLSLVPPKYFQDKGQAAFNTAPLGNGAYTVTEWKQDDHITLRANKDYWRGVPAIDTITFRLMPEASARVASLQAGESQILYALPPEQADPLKGQGFQVVSNSIAHSFIVVLRNNTESPLQDVRVRQAINYAIDKDLIIKELLAGFGRKLEGQIVGPDAVGFNPDLKAYPYDADKARALLKDAGYPDGFTIQFQGSAGRYIKDKEVEEAVVNQLSKVGIKANLEILESGVWLDKWINATYAPMFDVAILYGPFMDVEAALPSFTTFASPVHAYTDPKLDDLYRQQATLSNPDQRLAVLKQATQLMYEQAAALYLFQVPGVYAASKNVKGLDFRADYSIKDVTKLSVE